MKRCYEANITVLHLIEIDEDEIRDICEIPEDEEIPEEVFHDWVESQIDDYIRDNDMSCDVNDIEFERIDNIE